MKYLLQDKYIIFKDKSGKIKCSDLDLVSHLSNQTQAFIQKDHYQTVISSIVETLKKINGENEPCTLILNSHLFRCSGLINALLEKNEIETKIHSDLEFSISSQNLKSGEYSLIDIAEKETYFYNFRIEGKYFILIDKTRLENSKLKKVLAKKMESTSADILFNSLLNYSNIIEANQFIEYNDVAEEDYSNYTLSEISLGKILCTDFSNFFEKLCFSILDFIKEHTSNNKILLLKSPLTGYKPVKSLLASNQNIKVINELELLNTIDEIEFLKFKPEKNSYELNCFPKNIKIVFPFSSWMFSETGNLSLDLIKVESDEKESLQIDLNDLESKLSNTFFSLNDYQIVKYFVEFKMDIYHNIHFKIETLDKQEFYYLINS